MALSPLDIQTNLGHAHDVARIRQIENEHSNILQHNLDTKSLSDSLRNKDTVKQSEKGENIPLHINEDKSRQQKRREQSRDEKKNQETDLISNAPKDPLLGSHIDVTR
ncbi:MAG: hypothetical protein JXN63_08585 [Candidatus Delongbacteria bacterium]|nr:hypothetical protein [Candidatus Delongbacteria bacterium]